MATLPRELRKALESAVLAARLEAEAGSWKALNQLAVAHHEPWATMTIEQQSLRRRLRARGRQLGDRLEDGGQQGIKHLVSECAYEQWHRMLFARFLAECGLLIETDSGVSVSVDECKELARERGIDWISLASTFAQRMLPQIFRVDDAVLEIVLPAEHRQPLEQLLTSLPSDVFLADDSLGWVYQFWQSEEKDRVNEAEKKIGADELPAVTQLFTEDYMVEFLLHNTLGAWWAGRRFPDGALAGSEEQARSAVALPGVKWKYLRFIQNEKARWVPAAGVFREWPQSARGLRVLDPCMGSGHFLVFALPILVAMRMADENLSVQDAATAVLRDNLFGLEIDPRCTQIGAFNLALAAWKLADWQALPPLSLACSGLGLNARREDWVRLAGGDDSARRGMEQLYDLFAQSRVLGSLIDPKKLGGDLLASGFHALQPLFERALRQEQADETAHELAVTAQGVAKAAEILVSQFTLVVTNVPYLGRGKQDQVLLDYCGKNHPDAKNDLATCFVQRCLSFCAHGATSALVTPQSWLFQGAYSRLRKQLLSSATWELLARLGSNAFQDMNWWAAVTLLSIYSQHVPSADHLIAGLDVGEVKDQLAKARLLIEKPVRSVSQVAQTKRPGCLISFEDNQGVAMLCDLAKSTEGMSTGDGDRYLRVFCEMPMIKEDWAFFHVTPDETVEYGGLSEIVFWQKGAGELSRSEGARVQGHHSWGKKGVLVSRMNRLKCSLYFGIIYDKMSVVLVPKEPSDLLAIWAFCSSSEYHDAVRSVSQNVAVATATLAQVPFDLEHWKSVADEKYPDGLPKPSSTDPTQCVFDGHPRSSEQPLQVAVARLLRYRWPRQMGVSFPECDALAPDGLEPLTEPEGVICISATRRGEPAADRLQSLLASAFGQQWSAAKLDQLLAGVGYAGKTLEDWLRNGFFNQHCELFHSRPFIWHIWDGRGDGFSALVNCHELTKASLEKLTYAHLGDWISRQQAAVLGGEAGSDARLVAAKQLQEELKKILEGEPPYDLFIRWKPLARQPIGWEPDLNDGVRINIRPFMMAADVGKKGAGVLRVKPNIAWNKDRGKEASGARDEFPWFWGWDEKARDFAGGLTFDGNRWNDLHYSREFKMTARKRKGLS